MYNVNQNIFPKWITNKAMIAYFAALVVVAVIYSDYAMPWYYLLSGVVSVLIFFNIGNRLTNKWSEDKVMNENSFELRIFVLSLLLRLIWMLLIYVIFQESYGNAFGFENKDAYYYDDMGGLLAEGAHNGRYWETWNYYAAGCDLSDMGYATYVGLIYMLTDNSIIVVRILKCFWSALSVVIMYRLSKRNFGDSVGRLTAIFCMLWPNFWYYCGTHLKETEMVFLAVVFVNQTDDMLRARKFSAWKIIPILLISATLFTFRTPLALVTILCLLFSIIMSSNRVVGWGKRILIGILAVAMIGVTMGNRIQEQTQDLLDRVQKGEQQANMEWRSTRKDAGGNKNIFAKYAGAAVFAPLIFSIPFPTLTSPFDGQDVQKLLNGGNFIKNILSGFVIFAILMLLLCGNWRNHLVPLSYLIGYLVILVMSTFAQSERFHQPAVPMELMFAAYGISQVIKGKKLTPGVGGKYLYRRWFNIWISFMFVAAIAWNWFKIAGRGLE